MSAGAPRLRRATESDADLLLAWSNDPATRLASFHPSPIERTGHLQWLAARLASPTTGFWIGEAGGRPIGQIRVEVVADRVGEISIATAPEARGVGFGRALLRAGIEEARRALPVASLLARVRPDNAASIALFVGAGFKERGRTTCFEVPCVEYELILDRAEPAIR
jgi:RimJ/RimL family protein N-acetyltransferase